MSVKESTSLFPDPARHEASLMMLWSGFYRISINFDLLFRAVVNFHGKCLICLFDKSKVDTKLRWRANSWQQQGFALENPNNVLGKTPLVRRKAVFPSSMMISMTIQWWLFSFFLCFWRSRVFFLLICFLQSLFIERSLIRKFVDVENGKFIDI